MGSFPILNAGQTLPVQGFMWRTKGGDMIAPRDMETRHVFYTWLLIWNHSCPKELVRPEGRRYDEFGAWYTPQRMLTAFGVMTEELKRRHDLTLGFRKVVEEVVKAYAEWCGLDQASILRGMCEEAESGAGWWESEEFSESTFEEEI